MATTYQESLGGTPEFYQQGYQDLLTQGKAAAALPYTAYPGQQVAGLSPLQQQALQLTAGNVGAFTPYATAAQTAAQGALGAAQFSPEQLSQFMNPYTSGVVNEIGRLGTEQFQNVINPTLASTFQGLGQAGSARQAALLADAAAKSQREILGQQANALNTGYQNAMQSYRDWSGLGAQTGLSTASTLGNLGQAVQQAGLTDVGALTSAGALQQGQEQKALDVGYQNWQQQQQYPWQQLTQYKSLFPAAPSVTESWQTSFKKGGLARYADGGSFSEDDDLIQQQINKLLQQNATPAVQDNAMARQAMDMRQQFMQRLQQVPKAPPAPSFGEAAGQALMRASAAGPSNLGQLIGRAGAEYFDVERQRQKEAKADMLQRLMLEQRALPSVSLRGGPGTGGTGSSGFYMATDSDGRTWMINKASGERTPVAGGGVKSREAAYKYATNLAEDVTFADTAEKDAFIRYHMQEFMGGFPAGAAEAPTTMKVPEAAQTEAKPIVSPPEAERRKKFAVGGEETALKEYAEEIAPAAKQAISMLQNVQMLKQIPRTQDAFAPYREQLGSVMDAMGLDGKMAREASNLQQVRPLLAKIANDRLLLAKGVQTEGDAQRAYDEFIKITDTQKAADFMYAWTEELANRAKFKDELYRASAAEQGTWQRGKDYWQRSDYAQTAPVALLNGRPWAFSDWRSRFLEQNEDATIQDAIQEWNRLTKGGK